MRYDLTLRIVYDYGGPAPTARHVMRIMPRQIAEEQIVEDVRLRVDPEPGEIAHRADFWGNPVTEMGFHAPVTRLEMQVRAQLERLTRPELLDLSPPLPRLGAEIAARRALSPEQPHHFLSPSPRVAPDMLITEFARQCLDPGMTVLAAVRAVGRALHGHMTFDAKATDVNTPPGAAFAARHGVCQDFTHVMIAGLRSVGIPAGYVSGFLRTDPPPGRKRLAGADAMHAWLRAWCGAEIGWIEYDPTNDVMVGSDHIVVAVGRDYSDVAPIKGTVRTAGRQASRHSVDLVPLGA
ncbi:transglutaminase family protein [Roseivivax sediminis]|uniref:Transglutaminase-like enzyme, putative cysteine protease n=1 Tax=Roseivivax sediminis TaxID=936889 RepID=A0A1I2D3F0_9RHOB|nr:transglutaminase family protein [Roseivivax sediminis]SFE75024.1 Transglutaminase-like enzyme, putative cysteine protease [Roseivivax sediminis]